MAPREREEEGGLEVPIGVHPDCPNPEVIPLDTIDEFPVESVTKTGSKQIKTSENSGDSVADRKWIVRKKVSPLEMILASLIGLVEVVRLEYLPSFLMMEFNTRIQIKNGRSGGPQEDYLRSNNGDGIRCSSSRYTHIDLSTRVVRWVVRSHDRSDITG